MPPGGADVTYGGTIVEDLWRLDSRCQGTGNTAGRHWRAGPSATIYGFALALGLLVNGEIKRGTEVVRLVGAILVEQRRVGGPARTLHDPGNHRTFER
jgi:hypothetical protein